MTITVTMPCCGRTGRAPDEYHGRRLRGRCQKCGKEYDLVLPVRLVAAPGPTAEASIALAVPPSKPGRSAAWGLFACLAKAIVKGGLNYLTAGVPIASWIFEGWDDWNRQKTSEEEKRAEVRVIIETPPERIRKEVEEIVGEIAADQPGEARELLKTYLGQIPASIQRSLRSPTEASGANVPSDLPLRSAADLGALLPQQMPRFKPGDRPPGIGDWELMELLGTGGFGEVWKARNPNLAKGRPVALKFCLDPTAAQTLRNEAELLDQVLHQGKKHSGIVPLLHTYLSSDPPCLEYEYIDGGDLAGLIREWHELPNGLGPRLVERSSRVMQELAEIIAFAHHCRPPIVHRDLKPANVLVHRSPKGNITLRVSDFGIGGVGVRHALAPERNMEFAGPGLPADAGKGAYTPLYASRQQVRGETPDPTDDVYSLGIIWHQMLTGDLTKGCPTGNRWRERLLESGMKPEMVDLLGSCFEEEATDRPANAGVLADRLGVILANSAGSKAPAKTGSAELVRFEGHTNWVNCAVVAADGRYVLSGSSDKTVRLWNLETGRESACFKGHTKTVRSVALAPDARLAVSGGYDQTVRLWDVQTGRQVRCLEGHLNDVMTVAFSPDGRRVLSGSKDHSMRLWDAGTGQEVIAFEGRTSQVWCAAFSPDGRHVLSNGADNSVILWDATSGHEARVFQGHTQSVWCVALSGDGRFALSAGSDRVVHLWGVEAGREIGQFTGHTGSIWGACFSPDGRFAATCAYDKTIRIWEVASGQEVERLLGHTHYVMSVAYTPDGRHVVSASRDKTIRLWEVLK